MLIILKLSGSMKSYNLSFDVSGHAFNFLLGQSNQYNNFRSTTATGEDLPSDNISVLNGALSTSAKGDAAEAALRSFLVV